MTNGNYDKAASLGAMQDSRATDAPKPQTVFDEICGNLEAKIDRLTGMGRNLQTKNDRMSGAQPPEEIGQDTEKFPEAAIPKVFHTLDRLQGVITRIEHEVNRLDSIAG